MAIKGKSKARSRPRETARAPRREPVPVKPPLLLRRWVQVTAGFLLGALAVLVAVWVVVNLSRQSKEEESADIAAGKRTAALAWQSTVEGAIARVGTLQGGLSPQLFIEMNAAIDAMKKNDTVTPTSLRLFEAAKKNARISARDLTNFDLAGIITGQGFERFEAASFTESKDRLAQALTTYQRAAGIAILAARAPDAMRPRLVAAADALRSDANTMFQQAWSIYSSALVAGGITALSGGG